MYEQLTIVGNLGRDPEMRFTPSGKAVTNFSVAVNRKRGDDETTDWWRCVAFDKTGDLVQQLVEKGDPIVVSGEVQQDSYEKDGQTVNTVEVIVRDFSVVSARKATEAAPAPANPFDNF